MVVNPELDAGQREDATAPSGVAGAVAFPGATEGVEFTGERYIPGINGQIKFEHLHRYIMAAGLAAGRDVLDIACGEGYGSDALAATARSVFGVDIAEDIVAHAASRYVRNTLRFATGSLTDIPAADHAFDLVVAFETLEHEAEHERALDELRRVLRPGGLLLVSTPNRDAQDGAWHEKNPFHQKEASESELSAMLASRFGHVRILEQRFLHGSLIVPIAKRGAGPDATPGAAHTELISSGDLQHFTVTRGDAGRFYLIAMASDAELPGSILSLFDGGMELKALQDEFAFAVKTMKEQEVLLGQLKELEDLRQALKAVQTQSELKSIQISFLRKKLAA